MAIDPGVRPVLTPATVAVPTAVVKRDGRIVPFDPTRIQRAIEKCFAAIGRTPYVSADELAVRVVNVLLAHQGVPDVEAIQDYVERTLQAAGEWDAAKAYILYREEHARLRAERPVPDGVRATFAAADRYFPTPLQKFQYFDKYARFDHALGRRETWPETVDRAVDFLRELVQQHANPEAISATDWAFLRRMILDMKAMPSMRLLAMAGPAARRQNAAIYNCTYLPASDVEAFREAMLLSMSGCGVGFSVERQYVEQFPRVLRQKGGPKATIQVEDSAEGWGYAFRDAMHLWLAGEDCDIDYSLVRPAGQMLVTKGGRASGPAPLQRTMDFARQRVLARQGTTLRPLDVHDIMCAVGNAAVSGGVRRTAMISLFDWDDLEMRHCKDGDFEHANSQRWNANNSVVWPAGGPTQIEFMGQFLDMIRGERGEPGIFSRENAMRTMPAHRDQGHTFGTNPCGEIVLRPYGMCNLSISVARADDTYDTLREKVRAAAILGTIQSLATHFPHLRAEWKQNCEEERLLGVDITGQQDAAALLGDASVMEALRATAVATNIDYAARLGINMAASVTCVKPAGNSAALLDVASGLHSRWAPYYIRNARVSAHGPLFKVLRDAGAPMEPENGQTAETANTWVVSFPVRAPAGARTRNDRGAIEQCEWWLHNKLHWTTHNPSVTITYRPDEALDLMKWVYDHREVIGGMAFLPAYDAQYAQLPYIEITAEEYARRLAAFPDVDYSLLWRYEQQDATTASSEVACLGATCEVDNA